MREIPGNCESFISVNIGLFHTARALRWGLSPGAMRAVRTLCRKWKMCTVKRSRLFFSLPGDHK